MTHPLVAPLTWRFRSARTEVAHFPVRLRAWLAFRRQISSYRCLSAAELRATRKSDTIFIFGSGASLNDISASEWEHIAANDTLGFNWFVHQHFVRCDYHLLREIGGDDRDESVWRPRLTEYVDRARNNPRYAGTIFLVQTGFRATNGNRAIGLGLLPRSHPVFLWRSLRHRSMPSESLRQGLAHANGTLHECVNFAYLLGWRTIVLAGVDLYDRRYFWLPPDRPVFGDTSTEGRHGTAMTPLVETMGTWARWFADRGVKLFVHNPRSLLAATVPVWPRST